MNQEVEEKKKQEIRRKKIEEYETNLRLNVKFPFPVLRKPKEKPNEANRLFKIKGKADIFSTPDYHSSAQKESQTLDLEKPFCSGFPNIYMQYLPEILKIQKAIRKHLLKSERKSLNWIFESKKNEEIEETVSPKEKN